MLTSEELEILLTEEVQSAIDGNIERNPIEVALDKSVPHAGHVATQVKRLQRAKSKLPSYYTARAVLPPLAYEQSSSEEAALRKPLRGYSALDLTCGLGVDTFALSHHFERVVSLERNEVVASVARENLRRLGVTNVEVRNQSAEEFVAECSDHFDWCFVDPDRRGAKGEKLVRMEDCSPNVVDMMPALRRLADKICIKCSPLFDVDEAFRLFGDCVVETVSIGGEAKEVNIYLDGSAPQFRAVAIGVGEVLCSAEERNGAVWSAQPNNFSHYRYVTLPDVALQHSRMVAWAFEGKADVWSNNGVALSMEKPEGVLGRVFEIETIYEVDSAFKRVMKGRKAEIYRRDFPLSNSEICKRYRCSEGGKERWCFTRIGENLVAIKFN